jgi:hypothetical protein
MAETSENVRQQDTQKLNFLEIIPVPLENANITIVF